MDILFQERKLEKIWNNQSQLVKKYGVLRAKLLKRRLDEFRAADSLEDIRSLPQVRCHELKGNRQGTLAVDLDHPFLGIVFLSQPTIRYREKMTVA